MSRVLLVVAVLFVPLAARAQQCSIRVSCPGSGGGACSGSACNGEVTYSWAASCDKSGAMTSCVLSASTGQSCNCQGTGQCSIGTITCPCHDMCNGQCLDGSSDKCCNGQRVPGDTVCCPDGHQCRSGEECCNDVCMPAGNTCCPFGPCADPGKVCCGNGVQKCVDPGGSCCEDAVHYCPSGSDCVSNHCCPRLSAESSPFTAYDSTTGYCCGDTSCYAQGTCEAGSNLCVCAVPCQGSCCGSGTQCCPHKGWCAPTSTGCPMCPAGFPVDCLDGTCAPSGAICCGKGLFCPNGLSCVDSGGGHFTCGGGSPNEPRPEASPTKPPMMPAGSMASQSTYATQSSATSPSGMTSTVGGFTPGQFGTPGCGGDRKLGAGYECGCGGGGVEWLGVIAALLAMRRRR